MGLLDLASDSSRYRGFDYYKGKKVIKIDKINENEFESIVKGNEKYNIYLNLENPKNSTCDCPYADGTNTICKHIIATFFSVLPEEALKYKNGDYFYDERIDSYEVYEKDLYKKVVGVLKEMSKEELIDEILYMCDSDAYMMFEDFLERHYYESEYDEDEENDEYYDEDYYESKM